jgi:hypothetical protein
MCKIIRRDIKPRSVERSRDLKNGMVSEKIPRVSLRYHVLNP